MTPSQRPLPFQSHSDTSRAAAESVRPEDFSRACAAILAAIRASFDGLTDHEGFAIVGDAVNGSWTTYQARRVQLSDTRTNPPEVVMTDARRPTNTGRMATVWSAFRCLVCGAPFAPGPKLAGMLRCVGDHPHMLTRRSKRQGSAANWHLEICW